MLFSEIYSSYFNAAAAILAEAAARTLTGDRLEDIIRQKAFAESILTLPTALKTEWPLLEADLTTPIRHVPSMPLTTMEKRWMKTLLQDPRIALFDPDPTGLEEVEPLFDLADVVRFDQYLDGDPYGDETYIAVFRQLLTALREGRMVYLQCVGRDGRHHGSVCRPCRLEYSEKDDKFRLLALDSRRQFAVNVARIQSCRLLECAGPAPAEKPRRMETLTLHLWDERNALERVLLHFSHFEKETRRLGEREYQITLRYERADETELLIRVLSFGPVLQVTAPDRLIRLIRERLEKQSCEL